MGQSVFRTGLSKVGLPGAKEGRAIVEYFNPKPIHVAEAAISSQKEFIKLFIKLQDKNYEGSTYTLYYYAEKDTLAGFYYQATMDRTYKVIFLRSTISDASKLMD